MNFIFADRNTKQKDMEKKIKIRKTMRHNYVYDENQKDWVAAHQYVTAIQEYDESGHLLSSKSFNREGDPGEHNEYRYDAAGRVSEELIYFDEGDLAETHRYTYNEKGKVIIEEVLYQDGSHDKAFYTYDSDGNLMERRQEDDEGSVESLESNVYQGGNLIRETVEGSGGDVTSDATHTYDAVNRRTESLVWNPERDEHIRITYEYDERGNPECTEQYNGQGQIVARTTQSYDEKDRVVEILEEDTMATKTTRIQYDDQDRPVLQEEFNEKDELNLRIERTYDEEGELIESLVYVDRHDQGPDQYYAVRVSFEYFSGA